MLVISDRNVCQGANSYGQLGDGGVEDRPVPRLCDTGALKNKPVRVVTGGGGHTAVITGEFSLRLVPFSWIWNFHQYQWIEIRVDGLFLSYLIL